MASLLCLYILVRMKDCFVYWEKFNLAMTVEVVEHLPEVIFKNNQISWLLVLICYDIAL